MIVFWVNNGLNQVVEDEEVRDADFIASKELLLSKFFLCFELYRFNEFAVLVGYFFSSQKRALRMHDHDLFNGFQTYHNFYSSLETFFFVKFE